MCIWVRESEVDQEVAKSKTALFQRITTTEMTNEQGYKTQTSSLPITAWSYDTEKTCRKVRRKYCELACKDVQALKLAQTLCVDDHRLVPEDFNNTGELAPACAQIVLRCFQQARRVRADLVCAVNMLARSVTKWNKACDKGSAALVRYIDHTQHCLQYCNVGDEIGDCELGLFQDTSSAGFKNPTLEECYASSEINHSFQCLGCVRNKTHFLTAVPNRKSVHQTQV